MKKTHYKFIDDGFQLVLVETFFGYRVIIKNKGVKKHTSVWFGTLEKALTFYDLLLIWRQALCNECPKTNV